MNDLSNLQGLLQTAQRMQAEMARIKDELGSKIVSGETGGGLVKCEANGKGDIVSLTIDPAIVGEKKMLEDLIPGAVNQALDRARQLAQDELGRATAGLPIPPGFLGG